VSKQGYKKTQIHPWKTWNSD